MPRMTKLITIVENNNLIQFRTSSPNVIRKLHIATSRMRYNPYPSRDSPYNASFIRAMRGSVIDAERSHNRSRLSYTRPTRSFTGSQRCCFLNIEDVPLDDIRNIPTITEYYRKTTHPHRGWHSGWWYSRAPDERSEMPFSFVVKCTLYDYR